MFKKLLWSTILALSIATGCHTNEPKIEPPFIPIPIGVYTENKEAQERQELLEEIVEKHKIPHIADVIYYDESLKERYVQVMQSEYGTRKEVAEHFWENFGKKPYASITIIPNNLIAQGKNSILVVFPEALEKSKEDLLSFLVDHEAVHATDNATGITLADEKITPELVKKMGTENYEEIMELRAYGNQLIQIEEGKRNVTPKTMDFIAGMYCSFHAQILARAKSDKYSRSAIEQAPYFPMFDIKSRKIIIYRIERPK